MGMTNNTPTYCLLPTWILVVVEVNWGNESRLLHLKKYDFDMYDLLVPVPTNISHSVPSNNCPLVQPHEVVGKLSSAFTSVLLVISTCPK